MNTTFITPALKNFLNTLCKQYPDKAEYIESLSDQFACLDLSCQNHIQTQETFQQTLNLLTGDTVYLVWNVDDIIHDLQKNHQTPNLVSIKSMMAHPAFVKNDWSELLDKVSKSKFPFTHKTDYIILAQLPFFDGFFVIDGNHRIGESIIMKKDIIKAILLQADDAYKYLQSDSKRFIELIREINKFF